MPLSRYRALVEKADAFFERALARHPSEIRCGAGCDACCRTQLSVTPVEAAWLEAHLATLDPVTRARLAARAAEPDPLRCAALEADGRCAVYEGRPLVCRTHGLPVKLRTPRGLAVIQSCHLNFAERGPEAADPACVLDQETLSTLLAAVNAEWVAAHPGPPADARLPLAELLARG